MADNYADKIGLLYLETVGVGEGSTVVTKTTHEDMKEFLRRDKTMKVHAHGHELLAIENLYNITIHIFS